MENTEDASPPRSSLLASVVLLAAAIGQFVWLCGLHFSWIWLTVFIPALVMALGYCIQRRTPYAILRPILSAASIFLFLISLFISLVIHVFGVPIAIYTYEEILQTKWHGKKDHFPTSIPDNALMSRFECSPQADSGTRHLQLRLHLPPDDIKRLSAAWQAKAKTVLSGGGLLSHIHEPNGAPTTYFYTADTSTSDAPADFPEDYCLMMDYQLAQPADERDYRNCRSYGVAISVQRSEIVYWAEGW